MVNALCFVLCNLFYVQHSADLPTAAIGPFLIKFDTQETSLAPDDECHTFVMDDGDDNMLTVYHAP
jgi:hypothetical protein